MGKTFHCSQCGEPMDEDCDLCEDCSFEDQVENGDFDDEEGD